MKIKMKTGRSDECEVISTITAINRDYLLVRNGGGRFFLAYRDFGSKYHESSIGIGSTLRFISQADMQISDKIYREMVVHAVLEDL